MKLISHVALLSSWLVAISAKAAILPGPLVTPQWLQQNASQVTILDVRDDLDSFTVAPVYQTDPKTQQKTLSRAGGHIAGALLVDFTKVRIDREIDGRTIKAMLPDRDYFERLMRAVGVAKDKPIVITHVGETIDQVDTATRLYWSLKYYGQGEMAILNGGNAAWLAAGYQVSTEPVSPTKGNWTAGADRKEVFADSADVEKAIETKTQLVDARPMPQYLGITKKPVVLALGHIPGAVDLPTDVIASPSGPALLFLRPEQYRGVFKQLRVEDRAPSVTYCNTGHLASGAWFVMSEILGNKNVRLYDGSMHEWTAENRPVVGLN